MRGKVKPKQLRRVGQTLYHRCSVDEGGDDEGAQQVILVSETSGLQIPACEQCSRWFLCGNVEVCNLQRISVGMRMCMSMSGHV
jgi:hypothetical protein